MGRLETQARITFPDFAWGEVRTGDFGEYTNSSPLRFCAWTYFYRLDRKVHAGFIADILGRLTNGLYFYYQEGSPWVGDGGIGRCAKFRVIVAPTLRQIVEEIRAEDRHDIASDCKTP